MLCSCAATTQKFANCESFKSYSEVTWDATLRSYFYLFHVAAKLFTSFIETETESGCSGMNFDAAFN